MGRTEERGREFIPRHVEVRSAGQPSNVQPPAVSIVVSRCPHRACQLHSRHRPILFEVKLGASGHYA